MIGSLGKKKGKKFNLVIDGDETIRLPREPSGVQMQRIAYNYHHHLRLPEKGEWLN